MGWSEPVSVEVSSERWCEIREKSADRARHEGGGHSLGVLRGSGWILSGLGQE